MGDLGLPLISSAISRRLPGSPDAGPGLARRLAAVAAEGTGYWPSAPVIAGWEIKDTGRQDIKVGLCHNRTFVADYCNDSAQCRIVRYL